MTLQKPDLHQLVDAIRELTALGEEDMAEHMGQLNLDAQSALRRLVTRAVERGVELQRSAVLLSDEGQRPSPWTDDEKTPVVPVVEHDDGD